MAKKFKDYYDNEYANLIADKIFALNSVFQKYEFLDYISKNIEDKTFSERQEIFAKGFETYIPGNYEEKIELFYQILGPELKEPKGMFTHGWWLWTIGKYVELFGNKNLDLSLEFIYELTKRFTGEFAMRPLLENSTKEVMKTVLKWSEDENVHVRRLSSECLRLKLPWAKKSLVCIKEFETYKKVLNNLRNDPEKFVQKSVGNNINDLMKEYPDLANEIINEWEKRIPTKPTIWIIKHGKRSLKIK